MSEPTGLVPLVTPGITVPGIAPQTRRRQAVVAAINAGPPVTVDLTLGGVTVGPVRFLSSYVPTVGDTVWCLQDDTDLLVLGVLREDAAPVPQILTQDGGFPVAGSVTTEEDVLDRYTIAAVPWARRFAAHGSVFTSNTQSQSHEILWYLGAVILKRSQADVVTGDGIQLTCVAPFNLAANVAGVLELRLARVSGTGIVASSSGAYTQSTVIGVPT